VFLHQGREDDALSSLKLDN